MLSTAIVISSALAGTVMVALALGLVWHYRNGWLEQVRRSCTAGLLRHPVVLVHGVVGFDEINFGNKRHEYFRGVAERLRHLGVEVYRVRIPNGASVAVRAGHLARWIERIPTGRVNIIAHSMGGLDARYAIANLGIGHRVASLVTVGTPHRGTPLADIGTKLGDRFGLRGLLSAAGIDVRGFYDITTDEASNFNDGVQDHPGVRYGCVVGSAVRINGNLNLLLRPGFRYLTGRTGANDGLIPTSSQVWGEVLDEIDADHWAQIGWSNYFDAPAFYEKLVRELGVRGL
ncbi:MAG: hypothetical protein V3R77_05130 [Candidatus Binatia bacterium]